MTKSVRKLLVWGSSYLGDAFEARVLLGHCLGMDSNQLLLHLSDLVSDEQVSTYSLFVKRRALSEPIAYITGKREFFSRDFSVRPGVLIPRPETELLVEKSLELLHKRTRVLELCTGSGAIALSLKLERPDLDISATDISEVALSVARENAKKHGILQEVSFLQGDLFHIKELAAEGYDLIVANPPYVSKEEYENLPKTVRNYEPRLALVGDSDGLKFYHRIISEAPEFLKTTGMVLLEIGANQGRDVLAIANASKKYAEVGVFKDYAGHDRVLYLKREHTK